MYWLEEPCVNFSWVGLLVELALRMAHALWIEVSARLVLHTDRDTQFTMEDSWNFCQQLGIAESVGRTGVFR